MKIGVDLDGVCYDFTASLREYLIKEKWYNPACLPDATCWEFYEEDWGLTLKEFLTYCNEGVDAGIIFLHGEAYKDAVEILNSFKDDGHTIHIVTHRGFGSKSAANTEAWLKREGIPYDTLTFAKDKTVIPVDIFIEDNVDNYNALIAAGVDTVLMDRPWNQYATDANRIKSWYEFDWIVQEKEAELEEPNPSLLAAAKKLQEMQYETALEEATRYVYGDRNNDYGHPADDYTRTAAMWSALLKKKLQDGVALTPQDCIIMMIAVKLSRLSNDSKKRDSWVDVAGYAECGVRINRREEGLE